MICVIFGQKGHFQAEDQEPKTYRNSAQLYAVFYQNFPWNFFRWDFRTKIIKIITRWFFVNDFPMKILKIKFRFRDRIERRQWLQCLEDQTRPIRRTFLPKHVPQFPATPESHQIRSNFLATKKVHIDSNQQHQPPIPSALSMAYLEHSSMSQPETPNSKRRRSAISMVSSAFSKLKTKTASRLKKRVSFG